jgi:hypothetical protein
VTIAELHNQSLKFITCLLEFLFTSGGQNILKLNVMTAQDLTGRNRCICVV